MKLGRDHMTSPIVFRLHIESWPMMLEFKIKIEYEILRGLVTRSVLKASRLS